VAHVYHFNEPADRQVLAAPQWLPLRIRDGLVLSASWRVRTAPDVRSRYRRFVSLLAANVRLVLPRSPLHEELGRSRANASAGWFQSATTPSLLPLLSPFRPRHPSGGAVAMNDVC